ncbi:NAD(P)H-dependent oxidoreductase subunit E [Crassaminicella thermophila]|uniref:NAD(P)H-dependent oxidoreductase subunit E n=1 Tax=Crassaminicella thermophila TaxID=2599308 RepID=A0A5C0SGG9_CRATE|nr:NAD(P)H-dependent oxidoreductase subunit E [Crassaminicella thermophila]QEK12846.1 NAD(P)H-dependent oxidoreductase subunit E [Crassaminicella thermophila]
MKNVTLNKALFLKINEIIKKYESDKHNLLAILLETQDLIPKHYIPIEAAAFIGDKLNIPISRVYDVISFYSALNDKPKAQHVIKLCKSTTCRVNRYQTVRDVLEKELGIKMGQTTPDGKFALEYSACFGACDISPAFRIDTEVYGNLTEKKIKEIINKYKEV